jgi:hypothetical protein
MPGAKFASRGFTLIASLLLTLLLSGFAIALMMMVNTEQKVGAADLSNNYTYRAAEGAMEKMTSDLAGTFHNIQAPTAAQICAVSNNPPTWDPTITFTGQDGAYNVAPVTPGAANPCTSPLIPVWGPIQSGPDAGLYAQIIPVSLNVTAQRILGNSETVSMTRTAEVALIPVFQFGVFCDGDCFFGRSPNLGFAGRVHTNGDLYLGVADGYNLVFGDKISAFGNVIREQMDNGVASAGNDNGGTVMIPTTSGGCSVQMANVAAAVPSATCVDISTTALGATNGSVSAGHGSGQVAAWFNVSENTYNSYIIDGNGPANPPPAPPTDGLNGTGATDLTLPFVNGTNLPYQIIRRPPPGEATTSLLGGSRLANEAQIRVLLSDKEADLHLPGWNGDVTQDVELASMVPASEFVNTAGPFATTGGAQSGIIVNGNTYYFGESACGTNPASSVGNPCTNGDPNFIWPPWVPGGTSGAHNTTKAEWPIINGWLLVEVLNANTGLWTGVTKEWLQLGFARGLQVPTAPGSAAAQATNTIGATGSNFLTDHKNAILYFQMTADRSGNGSVTAGDNVTFTSVSNGAIATNSLVNSGANSQYNWYPINLYDAREGENNDVSQPVGTGTVNGIMNCVELDVGNLRQWLLGLTGTTGNTVNFTTQNGYVLYFSDRRGMQYDPVHSPAALLGAYGFEDVVNYAGGSPFAPNGTLEPVNYNGVSPEDVEQWNDGTVTTYGVVGVGDAFGSLTTTATDVTLPHNPFAPRIQTFTVGRANRVTGARHALKLVDASLGNLPTMPPGNASNNCAQSAANPTGCGGFTVGSENPVYIQGNYNSNCPTAGGADCTPGNANLDKTWNAGPEPLHAASAVIADAVSVLSNNWQDAGVTGALYSGSLVNPTNPGGQSVPAVTHNRIAVTTYYRVAIAGGKNIAFLNTVQNPEFSFGMDGGIHNFLRFLEDWGGQASQQSLNYKGSLVSLYYATYATGTFKCCNTVYNPPNRNYVFDPLFSVPQNLPPGTPMFRNVDNLSYRQNQVARTN